MTVSDTNERIEARPAKPAARYLTATVMELYLAWACRIAFRPRLCARVSPGAN